MDEIAAFFVHEATVEPLIGANSLGELHGPPVTVPCLTVEARTIVKNTDGVEVVSTTTLYCAVSDAASCTPGSLATTFTGKTATVITTTILTSGDLGLPDHAEVYLT